MARHRRPFATQAVADAYAARPPAVRQRLLRLRDLIFATAAATEGVGAIEETLKWGEPSYLTSETRSGTTIRIDRSKADGGYALYVNCQTDLVATFRERYPQFSYEGKRAIVFNVADEIDEAALGHCIALALTYRLRKRRVTRPKSTAA